MGSAHTVSPAITGMMTYVLSVIARIVMLRTRSVLSCSAAIAGSSTLLVAVLILFVRNCGICSPLL